MRNEDHFTRLAGKYFDTQSLKPSLLVRIGAIAYNLLCLQLSSCYVRRQASSLYVTLSCRPAMYAPVTCGDPRSSRPILRMS